MSSKHYFYPTTSNGRSTLVDRERVFDKDHERGSTRYDSSDHSDTPSLSRASTPSSFSSPPTPTLSPAAPLTDAKMRGRHVEFASPVTHAYRRPEWDELSVMRAFSSHAGHCDHCHRSLSDHKGGLCDRGLGLAKDLGTYFYSYDGKPHSNTDRKRGREKVQVEVPVEYSSVKGLFEALNKGLELKRPKSSKPELHQSSYTPTPRLNSRRYSMDSYPTQSRRRYLDHEDYDLRPARSDSHRGREPVYRVAGGRYVDTSHPSREDPSDRRRPHSPSTPLTPRTPSPRNSSGVHESELRKLSEDLEKYRSRRNIGDKDRYRKDEYSSRHSDRSSRSGDIPSRSSDRSSRSSDYYSRLPDRSSISNDLPSRATDRSPRSSDRRSRLSDLSSWMKERPPRSSEPPLRSRDRSARLTEPPSRSTYRSSKSSELPSRLSDRSSRYDDRYTRVPRRSESYDDKYARRRDSTHGRRSADRHYHSDDDYRRPKRSSSYLPFSSLWR